MARGRLPARRFCRDSRRRRAHGVGGTCKRSTHVPRQNVRFRTRYIVGEFDVRRTAPARNPKNGRSVQENLERSRAWAAEASRHVSEVAENDGADNAAERTKQDKYEAGNVRSVNGRRHDAAGADRLGHVHGSGR